MREEQLYAIGTGGGSKDDKINLIEITFEYNETMDLETTRCLMVRSTETLLGLIEKNKLSKEYFENYPPNINALHIAIIGVASPSSVSKSLDASQLIKGKIYYLVENPYHQGSEPYLTVHEESFEEAKEIVDRAAHTCDN